MVTLTGLFTEFMALSDPNAPHLLNPDDLDQRHLDLLAVMSDGISEAEFVAMMMGVELGMRFQMSLPYQYGVN